MPTLDAELAVAGHTYPVLEIAFAFDQPVDGRGRPVARVHPEPIRLVLDVPTDGFLLHWAAAPHLAQAGHLTFFASGLARVAYETVLFAAGQCVSYREEFRHGDRHHGAYHCYLTIVAPRYELLAGEPGAALAAAVAAPRPVARPAAPKPPTPVVQGWCAAIPPSPSPTRASWPRLSAPCTRKKAAYLPPGLPAALEHRRPGLFYPGVRHRHRARPPAYAGPHRKPAAARR